MAKCKCCEKNKELRFGFCIDCANAETVIIEGVDMYENRITKEKDMSMAMSKYKYLLKKLNLIKNK